MSGSPYAPPSATVADPLPQDQTAAEALRQAHVRHEIQLKSVGALYYFSGAMTVLFTTVMLISPEFSKGDTLGVIGAIALLGGLGLVSLAVGYGLRRLKPWVQIPTAILSAIGLLAFPVGTLINGWILYLLFCEQGRMVLSQPYQQVIADTPHVKYRRSVGDWIALIVLLLIVLGIMVLIVAANL